MPLIIMCGIPGSGKTKRANDIYQFFKDQGKQVVLVNEESLFIKRSEGYKDSFNEKMTRGSIKSEVERNISKNVVVIADSLNYIKGFRYELFCLARACATPHCVIYCDTPQETSLEWNKAREDEMWDEKLLGEIVFRFEEPNDRRKWDDPCYRIEPDDELPSQAIFDFFFNSKTVVIPNPSTAYSKMADTNYLYDIDKITTEAVATIHAELTEAPHKLSITIPGCNIKLKLVKDVTLAELRRLRRQFVKISREMASTKSSYTNKSQTEMLDSFIEYINTEIENSN